MIKTQVTIYDSVKEDIIKGAYKIGSLLPTEQILAKKHSVSRPTISKVYNKLQIEGYIIKKRGYGSQIINNNGNHINTFGLLLPGSGESEIFNIINDQILKLSKKNKFNCFWEGATASDAEIRKLHIENYCDHYIQKEVDGIIFCPLERVPDADAINLRIFNKIINAGIPLVLVDRSLKDVPEVGGYDIVWLDNFDAGRAMGQHLINKGCEVIHFFYRPGSANSVNYRLSGVRDIALSNNLKFTKENECCGDPDDIDFVKKIKIVPGKTGFICANDSTAAVLLSSLETLGVKITSDCLICGYDNMKYSEYLKYSLTSYIQPCEEIANISIELILRRIKNNNQIPLKVNLDGKIITRESTTFNFQ